VFHRRGLSIGGMSIALAMCAGLLAPAAALATPLYSPPAIAAAFAAPSMSVGWAVALTFTITNAAGNGPVTGVGFSDTLPTGLTVTSGTTSVCGTGTFTRTSPSTIVLSGASIADGSTCVVSAMVTGVTAGSYSTTTGTVSSTEGGPGNTATAAIDVNDYPSIGAVFAPSSVGVGATTQLTFTITNPAGNPDALKFIGLTDTLPTGLTVASAAATTTCGVGSLTVTAPNSIVLSAATVAVGSPCQFSVSVTAGAAGAYTNTVTATLGGFTYAGNTATAALGVAAPAPTSTLPPTSTAGGGTGGQAPASLLFALMALVGLAAAGLTLRSRTGVRR
jgi:uncharacterized repeat protein (TIGR01451 family)